MTKTTALVYLGALVLAGCSNPQSKAREAEASQREADAKGAYASEDARLNAEAVQRKADAENAVGARKSEKKSAEAQGEADKKWSEASASLTTARTEAREHAETKLAALETDAADVRRTLVKKLSRTDFVVLADDLTARSEAATASIRALDSATADTLEPAKSAVALRLGDYDSAITDAKKRI